MQGIGWCGDDKPAHTPSDKQAEWDLILAGLRASADRIGDTLDQLNRMAESSRDHLPAQTPIEDQIVAALKADPAMAGRVMAKFSYQTCGLDRNEVIDAAKDFVTAGGSNSSRGVSLQSLAVALAAASYRG